MSQNTTTPKYLTPWLGVLLLIDAAGLGWVTLIIFRVSSGSGRALAFGLSAPSLLLVGLTLLAAIGFFALGLATLRGNLLAPKLIEMLLKKPALSIGLLTGLFLAGWLIALTPAERFASGYYYALRLLPIAGWLAFASGTGALFLLVAHQGLSGDNWWEYLRQNRALLVASAVTLVGIVLVAWLASARIYDVTPAEEDYWYGAGVPVLAWQVITAIAIGLATAWAEKKFRSGGIKATVGKVPVDVILFVSIWVVAGFLWANSPLAFNFMVSTPYPPNHEPYPAADGMNYDLSSQFALIGQGLFNRGQMLTYFERPLYSAFLLYLHLLAGQNFTLILNLQAVIFAAFPAIAYLIGKTLHSRGVGASLAAILTLRGVNGLLAGGMLENSTQKMFLTDFPTAIGMALILLLALRWAKKPAQNWRLAGWLCGAIGLWGFVRPHIIFLLPFAGLLAVVLYFRQKRKLAALAGFMLAAYLAVSMPWMQFNGSGVSLISMYLGRVQSIIRERYPDFLLPKPGGSLAVRQVASLDVIPIRLVAPQKSVTASALDHFLNNLVLSALSLPATLRNYELITIVKQSESYWKPYWNGTLSPSAKVLVPFNLVLLALGIGLAWKRARSIGLFPLFGMLIYSLINSLARTSGGRYLVPVDWVFSLYYVLGLAAIFEFSAAWFNPGPVTGKFTARPTQMGRNNPLWQGLTTLALLCAIGSLIPLANSLQPRRYPSTDKTQLAAKVEQRYLDQLGVSRAEWQAFLAQPDSVLNEGRALYPRYILRSINPFIPGNLLEAKLYSRLNLVIIGPQGYTEFILPGNDEWYDLPHASDVLLVGCQTAGFIDGWALILEPTGEVHLRLPTAKLTCPFPEPVCNNNGGCK